MFGDNIHESKLEAVMAIAALLQGPYEVGNNILAREGVVEIMLAMADSGSAIYTVDHEAFPVFSLKFSTLEDLNNSQDQFYHPNAFLTHALYFRRNTRWRL